jgi:hypothetical protein
MATYVNNLRLKEIATGAESGTWGTSTNTNLELIADAFGSGTEAITTNADTHTTTVADGSADEGRAIYMKYTGTLDSACTISLLPNTINKLWIVENATSGSQNIIISQGSGANITIGNGKVAAIFTDGAGSGAAVLDAFADLELSSTFTVAGNVDFNGDLDVDGTSNLDVVDIDGAVDMASTLTLGSTLTVNAGAVFNEASADVDFRVESNGNANMLFVDGGEDRIGIGLATPQDHLEVRGPSEANGGITISNANATGACVSFARDSTATARIQLGEPGTVGTGELRFLVSNEDGTPSLAEAMTIEANKDLTTFGGAVFNEGSADVDFRVETNNNANMFFVDGGANKVGVNTGTPTGILEVYTSDSGASPDTSFDEFVIESSGTAGISILTGASNSGGIMFGDSGDNGRGKLYYDHNADAMKIAAGGSVAMTIDSSQNTSIPATKKFYLDGGGDTYIHEVASNQLRFTVGGNNVGTFRTNGLELLATDKLWLDGGGDTYIYEHAANTIRFYCGAEENISLYENDILMPGAGSKIYWDGGIDTYTTLISNNIIGWYCGDTEAMRLTDGAGTITGSWTITGALSKGSGTFKIDHPIKPETHDLIHSFVEGPRADLIYRGVVSLSDGWAEVDLDEAVGLSEGTWAALCRDPQVWVQNTSGWDAIRGSVEGSTLTIECADSGSGDTVSWLVVAERQDDHIREVDWTDDEGHPILEPEKEDDGA